MAGSDKRRDDRVEAVEMWIPASSMRSQVNLAVGRIR